jgi:hypothetical protein
MDRRDSIPLDTREALEAFTQRLVEQFPPEQIVLFGSMARGEARWDSDADLLVVMPYEGEPWEMVEALLAAGNADFDPGEGDPEPTEDTPWALAKAAPLRDCLRRWFDSLEMVELQEVW